MCLCTGMLYDPKANHSQKENGFDNKVVTRLNMIKKALFLKNKKA
jgi:hypothetical protein